MTQKSIQLEKIMTPHKLAQDIAGKWDSWNKQRQGWLDERKELRDYLFATDTTTTSNQVLDWKNSTTTPKLTQIRDNLHSNYISALFPNDDWLKWEGYSSKDTTKKKRRAIQAYMANKAREGDLRQVCSQLLYDYIDFGNAFCDVKYEDRRHVDPETGEEIQGFVGPKLVRINPYDLVFDPTAVSFNDSPVITRSLITLPELARMAEQEPDNADLQAALKRASERRSAVRGGSYSYEDVHKASGYQNDGFGNIFEYYQGDYVEVLELDGDMWDMDKGELLKNRIVTVIDRADVIRNKPNPSWLGRTKFHVGWRTRPDNVWAMGPLDNLVGLQYRIDHLENAKADALDLTIHPPFAIYGDVEEFVWGPGEEIHLDENGRIDLLTPKTDALNANFEIQRYMDIMELMAGAPREAMGIRSPGEKTAFEVQQLITAATRIFQEKINSFEMSLLEPALNAMLEVARRNIDGVDVVGVMDDDLAVKSFLKITKDDITARGKLRPVGSRHFAQTAKTIQDLNMLLSSGLGQAVGRHLSTVNLSRMVEDLLGIDRYDLFRPNVAIFENAEAQKLQMSAQTDVNETALTPPVEE